MTEVKYELLIPVPCFTLKLQFLTLQILLSAVIVLSQEDKITCEVTSVEALKNTSLTCHFPVDITQTDFGVSVYLYREEGNASSVLNCWRSPKLYCNTGHGYKLTENISHVLTIHIPRATADQTGKYSCQLTGGSGQPVTFYFNIMSGNKTICDAPSVRQGSPAWLSCYFSENVGESKRDFAIYHVSSQGFKESVLTCTWSEGSLTCHTARDYQFDRRITNTATVKIPKVSASHTGTYSCQLADAAPGDYEDCVFSLDQGQQTSCNIPSVKLMEQMTLTCNFSVDVNKTKSNFGIVHFSDPNKSAVDVLKCVWQNDDIVCEVTRGYEFSRPMTDHVTVTIPRANHSHVGEYMCQLHNSDNNATRCLFLEATSKSYVPVIAGVVSVVVFIGIVVLLVICCVIRLKKRNRHADEEAQPMLSVLATNQTTKRLQESLSASIQTMYPDILTACYFVPSLYINRNTYTKVEVAGEKVVVMEAAPDDTLRQDHAIQHVLNCLRHLADRDQQAMFVLSQFTCDDYLASVDEQFAHHKLPMPSDLTRRDKDYENFDVLIVHRHYGVVVVVVKASVCTADMGVEKRDNERVVQDLREAVKQLDGAERMLKHLMADLRPSIVIHKTLMLPNLSETSLREILGKQKDVAKKCTGLTKLLDISGGCLCADHLHSDNMVDNLHAWIQLHSSESGSNISKEMYQAIISRFCGPATRPSLTLPDGRRVCTPSSLQQAVSLTGELFNGAIIHPKHHQLLTDAPPRVFLSGPPGSGKTVSLVLIGKKWMSEGHQVCVLSTWRENVTTSKLLHGMLLKDKVQQSKEVVCNEEISHENSTYGKPSVTKSSRKNKANLKNDLQPIYWEVDLDSTNIEKAIEDKLQLSTIGELFILVDDAGPIEQKELFHALCNALWAANNNLHLWAASSSKQPIPKKWKKVDYQPIISCPPSILRERELINIADKEKFTNLINLHLNKIGVAPTEGLPVKIVYHSGEGHSESKAYSCTKCSSCVVDLLKALHIKQHRRETGENHETGNSPINTPEMLGDLYPNSLTPRLYPSDVLVLFEHERCEKTSFYKNLIKDSGLNIKVVNDENIHLLSEDNGDVVLAADGRTFRGLKRKVVVYVEGLFRPSNTPLEWTRLCGAISCTAQLIWVRG